MKTCARCKQQKDPSEFSYHKNTKDNKQPYCRPCVNEYARKPEMKAARDRWRKNNPEKAKAATKRWIQANPERHRANVYKFAKEKKEQYVAIQDRYQTRIPPGVYIVKYMDTVIYVGSARRPQNRMNLHLSSIKTRNNITKVNKLHSFCGYDKSEFTAEVVHNCEPEHLLEWEAHYEEFYNAKANYKRLLPDALTIKEIHARFFGEAK